MKLADIQRSPIGRVLLLMVVYAIALSGSLWMAYLMRFDFEIREIQPRNMETSEKLAMIRTFFLWIIPMKLGMLAAFRQFEGLLSYFSVPDLRRLYGATAASSLLMYLAWKLPSAAAPPRGVILIDFILSFLALASIRLGFRVVRERFISGEKAPRRQRRVAIIGAGDVGASLAKEIMAKRFMGMTPVAFF